MPSSTLLAEPWCRVSRRPQRPSRSLLPPHRKQTWMTHPGQAWLRPALSPRVNPACSGRIPRLTKKPVKIERPFYFFVAFDHQGRDCHYMNDIIGLRIIYGDGAAKSGVNTENHVNIYAFRSIDTHFVNRYLTPSTHFSGE